MKLNVLYESYDDALDSMYRYLDGLGIVDSAVKKIFRFASSGRFHSLPGGGGKEIDQLKAGRRLIAWVKEPVEGYESMRGLRDINYYVFDRENLDVAWLLKSVNEKREDGSVASHILNGLAFGYPPDDVYSHAKSDLLGLDAADYLKECGVSSELVNAIGCGGFLVKRRGGSNFIRVNHEKDVKDEWVNVSSLVGEVVQQDLWGDCGHYAWVEGSGCSPKVCSYNTVIKISGVISSGLG